MIIEERNAHEMICPMGMAYPSDSFVWCQGKKCMAWQWVRKCPYPKMITPWQERGSTDFPFLTTEPDRKPENVPLSWVWKPADLDEDTKGSWIEPEDEAKARATGFCLKCYNRGSLSIDGCVTTCSGY